MRSQLSNKEMQMQIQISSEGWLCIDLGWIVINCHGCKDGEYPFGWFNVTLYKFHATTKLPNHVIFTKPVINR
jgi:hypothetical protein